MPLRITLCGVCGPMPSARASSSIVLGDVDQVRTEARAEFLKRHEKIVHEPRLIRREAEPVKRVDDHRHAGEISGEASKNSRFRRMRVQNLRFAFCGRDDKVELSAFNVFDRTNGPHQRRNKVRFPVPLLRFIVEQPAGPGHQERRVTRAIKSFDGIQRVLLRTAQLQLGDEMADAQLTDCRADERIFKDLLRGLLAFEDGFFHVGVFPAAEAADGVDAFGFQIMPESVSCRRCGSRRT